MAGALFSTMMYAAVIFIVLLVGWCTPDLPTLVLVASLSAAIVGMIVHWIDESRIEQCVRWAATVALSEEVFNILFIERTGGIFASK